MIYGLPIELNLELSPCEVKPFFNEYGVPMKIEVGAEMYLYLKIKFEEKIC